jgi:hypothetical protein
VLGDMLNALIDRGYEKYKGNTSRPNQAMS